nr:MAG TPA: hypothetical protein [Caudoviricetes sp.]
MKDFNENKTPLWLFVEYENNETAIYRADTLKINRETGFITIERKNKYTSGIVIDSVRSVEIKF